MKCSCMGGFWLLEALYKLGWSGACLIPGFCHCVPGFCHCLPGFCHCVHESCRLVRWLVCGMVRLFLHENGTSPSHTCYLETSVRCAPICILPEVLVLSEEYIVNMPPRGSSSRPSSRPSSRFPSSIMSQHKRHTTEAADHALDVLTANSTNSWLQMITQGVRSSSLSSSQPP